MDKTTILLVGSTGKFGTLVSEALRSDPRVHLRVLNRHGVQPRTDREVLSGDVTNPAIADLAVHGVDVVISAVNGGPDVMVDGQLTLLAAALRHGVRRFIPSDYSGDYFGLDDGDNVFLDMHRRVAQEVMESGTGYSIILTGGFMETSLAPFMGVFDFRAEQATPWGTGSEPLDLTSMRDAASVVAAVALDDRALNQVVRYVGETTSVQRIAEDFEAVTGRPLVIIPRGSVETLHTTIDQLKARTQSPLDYVFAQYQLGQLLGKTRLWPPFRKSRLSVCAMLRYRRMAI